jgi:hypothetical protein
MSDLSDVISIKVRKTKLTKYVSERKLLLLDLFRLLGLSTDKRYIVLDDLYLDVDKQNLILDLSYRVQLYFLTSTWLIFKSGITIDRPYLSLIKHILKHESIKYFTSRRMICGKSETLLTVVYDNFI